jgi:diguanylate cyclase (GGDEF)-like protein
MKEKILKLVQDDIELEQALIRCFFVLLVGIYLFTYPQSTDILSRTTLSISIFYLAVSFIALSYIFHRPGENHPRRIILTILDQVMIAYCVSFGGHTSPVIALVYWVIIGAGYRFGKKYLYLSAVTGLIGISYNIIFSPAWSNEHFSGVGYLLSITIIAIYTRLILSRANNATLKLNETMNHLNNLAHFDFLTGLPNRMALVVRLKQSIAMTKRLKSNLSLLYFDLDGFKAVNDMLGHSRGDNLLQEVAKKIKDRIRSTEILARIGGDEFVVVLEGITNPEDSKIIADIILETIRSVDILPHLNDETVATYAGRKGLPQDQGC